MKSKKTSVSRNLQTYIPRDVQLALDIKPESKVEWIISNGEVKVKKAKSPVEVLNKVYGIASEYYKKKGGGKKALLKEREESWKD